MIISFFWSFNKNKVPHYKYVNTYTQINCKILKCRVLINKMYKAENNLLNDILYSNMVLHNVVCINTYWTYTNTEASRPNKTETNARQNVSA